jgi:eukaryotic-like serine/threonine-protein kinase
MDPERWSRIDTLFHRAVSLHAADRAAWLATECRGDELLRSEVERLLEADTSANELVDRFEGGALRPPEDPLLGREIGLYRLTGRIAVGGMGVVYQAERTDGLFAHDVAIKLIRSELASENLIRRFEFERRTLATLHHPHIAQLYDGGTTADGRPYLVMELVRGIPIDRYCDERGLSIEDRLRLFVDVCRTVHFAHQNLVVHRDLKPANILIDETGIPKLLDFGIARLLEEGNNASGNGLTQPGGNILTPEYASPEQLASGTVTTAMDVYSLGVVLYELVTGRRPFRSDNKSPIEWHRDVSERTPTRPSNVVLQPEPLNPPDAGLLSSPIELAAQRGCSPKTLRRRLRGDVDRIVLMALRKEPERRYASAKDMADDIERHFSGHPLLARGDSVTYSATKFVQRNRLAMASAAVVFGALVVGILLARRGEERARIEAQRARDEAQHARIEAESFQGIAEFLMDSFLTSSTALDDGLLAQKRQRIQMHAAQLRREYGDQDHLRANLLDSLGHVAERLGLLADAEALVDEALAIREGAFGTQSLEYALSLRSQGKLHYAKGEFGPAAELFGKALAIHRAHAHETHTDVASLANDLGACLRNLGRSQEAEALHREALALRRSDGDGGLAVAESLNNLAGIDLDRNDLAAAAQGLEEALAIRRRILGNEDPLTLQSMSNLATTVMRLGQRDRAYALLDEVEAGFRLLRVDGEDELAHVLSNRAVMLLTDRKYEAAEPLLDEALLLQMRRLGPKNPAVASTLARQAYLLTVLKRPAEARVTWERALAIRREPNASPRYLAQTLYDYGVFLYTTKALADAGAILREALGVLQSSGAAESPLRARAELAYGEVLIASGDRAGARAHLETAVAMFTSAPAGQEADLAEARMALAQCTGDQDR